MGQYSKKGLYSKYDKNNIERQKEDYYATPIEEVTNIMNTIKLPINKDTIILEPCCGGGHMVEGILNYSSQFNNKIIATDIRERNNIFKEKHQLQNVDYHFELDYLSDDYPYNSADYIIMNPPFKLIEPFVIRSLEIAEKGILMFGRLQFLEGENRYNTILKDNPPSEVYVYVDRVACYKDGDFSIKPNSVQAYAWFYWDIGTNKSSTIHFLRRYNKINN